tara:strand:- start:12679 stop:13458 length:780 start_codon:yes stop_codon:yes gene_type:complete
MNEQVEQNTVADVMEKNESTENVSRETSVDAAIDTIAPVERPEWLPEKFTKAEDLAKSYTELETMVGKKEEEYRDKFQKELEEEAFKDRPESKGEYVISEEAQKLLDMGAATDNKLLEWWSQTSFENGYNQEEFNSGIMMYLEQISETLPNPEQEMQKLGDNANVRVEAASLFANQYFPKNLIPTVELLASTAEGVQILEHIQEQTKGINVSSPSQPINQINEAQLRDLMASDEYHNPTKRNPEVVRQVESGFKQLYKS